MYYCGGDKAGEQIGQYINNRFAWDVHATLFDGSVIIPSW
jgi:hypothetical protein